MWILKTNVTVGCHLVNLTLEEVSLDVAVRGRMAAVIVFLHEFFQFIGSRDAPIVPIEFLHLADEVFGEFHVEVRVLVNCQIAQRYLPCSPLGNFAKKKRVPMVVAKQ